MGGDQAIESLSVLVGIDALHVYGVGWHGTGLLNGQKCFLELLILRKFILVKW